MFTYERYNHAGEIPLDKWYRRGVEVLILDKDGHLAPYNSNVYEPEVINGLIANGIQRFIRGVGLVSNNSDPNHVREFGKQLSEAFGGLEVFTVCQADEAHRKPHPGMGLVVADHFGVTPEQIGVSGDRRFIDVTFGRKLGAGAIALCEKVGDGDHFLVPPIRFIEDIYVKAETGLGIAQLKVA